MEREILFGAKAKNNGNWLYGDLHRIDGKTYIFNDEQLDYPDNYEVDPETLGQLLFIDAYGEKVFTNSVCCDTANEGNIFTIGFDGINYYADWLDGKEHARDLYELYERSRIEALGNIHDNPELLNN